MMVRAYEIQYVDIGLKGNVPDNDYRLRHFIVEFYFSSLIFSQVRQHSLREPVCSVQRKEISKN